MQVYVCVRCFGYLPVISDLAVVLCLLWRLHRRIGEDVGSLPVFPVWSECVCVVCVLMRYWCFVCLGGRVRSDPCVVFNTEPLIWREPSVLEGFESSLLESSVHISGKP